MRTAYCLAPSTGLPSRVAPIVPAAASALPIHVFQTQDFAGQFCQVQVFKDKNLPWEYQVDAKRGVISLNLAPFPYSIYSKLRRILSKASSDPVPQLIYTSCLIGEAFGSLTCQRVYQKEGKHLYASTLPF